MAKDLLVHNSQTRNPELLGFFEGVFALANPGEYISIGKKTEETKCGWMQVNYRLSDLLLLLRNGEAVILGDDLYFAPNTFRTPYSRTKENLASFNSFFLDLDYEKIPELNGAHPEQVLDKAITCCHDNGLPRPSCDVATGHGLHLYWLLDKPLKYSKATEKDWLLVQKTLCGILAKLGADGAALDAARVLRVPGTLNAKDKNDKREVFCVSGSSEPLRVNYQMMLWWAQAHGCKEPKTAKPKKGKRKKPDSGKSGNSSAGGCKNPRNDELIPTWRRVNTNRIADFEQLLELRNGDMGGYRNNFLLYYKEAHVGLYQDNKDKIKAAILAMNARFTQPLKVEEAEGILGKKPYYTQTNESLVRILNITPEEQTYMRTIIGEEEYNRRRALNNKYGLNLTGKTEHFCQAILACLFENLPTKKIAEQLSIARSTVCSYIKRFDLRNLAKKLIAAGTTATEQVKETVQGIVAAKSKPRKKRSPSTNKGKPSKAAQSSPTLQDFPEPDELNLGSSPYIPTEEDFWIPQEIPMPDPDAIESLAFEEPPPQVGIGVWHAPLDESVLDIAVEPELLEGVYPNPSESLLATGVNEPTWNKSAVTELDIVAIDDEDIPPYEAKPLVIQPLPPERRTRSNEELFAILQELRNPCPDADDSQAGQDQQGCSEQATAPCPAPVQSAVSIFSALPEEREVLVPTTAGTRAREGTGGPSVAPTALQWGPADVCVPASGAVRTCVQTPRMGAREHICPCSYKGSDGPAHPPFARVFALASHCMRKLVSLRPAIARSHRPVKESSGSRTYSLLDIDRQPSSCASGQESRWEAAG